MTERIAIGLDNSAFRGRLRRPESMELFADSEEKQRPLRRPLTRPPRVLNQQHVIQDQPQPTQPATYFPPIPKVAPSAPPKVYYRPKVPESALPQPATFPIQPIVRVEDPVPMLHPLIAPREIRIPHPSFRPIIQMILRYSKLQFGLVAMAVLVFIVGMSVSYQTFQTNHVATAQVAALAAKSSSGGTGSAAVPSIAKPSATALSNYVVAPDLPRYIKIPKLGVDARVLQVGLTSSGALGTPDNIYDTAWYTGSALPGQDGATLIDGHISSWTSKGVFYGLNRLTEGDSIQITTGNGDVYTYTVVSTQVYNANNVNMQSAITPVDPGAPGLNLISCTGNVIKGTSLFDERIIVYARQELSING